MWLLCLGVGAEEKGPLYMIFEWALLLFYPFGAAIGPLSVRMSG